MNEPPERMRVGLTALTMAEYFRDVNKQDVLLFIDNIFFTQAGSEVSALLDVCIAVGYQPTLATEMGVYKNVSHRQQRFNYIYPSSLCTCDDLTDPAQQLHLLI